MFGPNQAADVPLAAYHSRRSMTGGEPAPNTECNVDRAARSTLENLANRACTRDVAVSTIGLGPVPNQLETELDACIDSIASEILRLRL